MEAAALDIFLPVMESAVVLAAHYCKAAGRDCVQAEDMRIGLMFAARNVAGKHLGTLYPELYEEESCSDSDEDSGSGSWETVSDGEESPCDSDDVWTPYTGTEDEMARRMNECAETWDAWEPETPAERALKNAVDKQREE